MGLRTRRAGRGSGNNDDDVLFSLDPHDVPDERDARDDVVSSSLCSRFPSFASVFFFFSKYGDRTTGASGDSRNCSIGGSFGLAAGASGTIIEISSSGRRVESRSSTMLRLTEFAFNANKKIIHKNLIEVAFSLE